MYKILVLTPVIAMLGLGNALAFDAASGFGPSDANDEPVPRFQLADPVDRSVVTAGIATRASRGAAAGIERTGRFSAAWGFGPSDANDEPVPRFQTVR
ncbi:hypothetical protein [Chelativorans intermedius]|uniref:Uncharacterized protein n=1 Tax=Chelativorans intermedius TaxID=515947 RepID=A0ABV6DAP2_9HYPH|nr:hypothetical protein [Chelativorans intermedius]MCT9000145.1 hypothetical protein [Chelativorans intermedius]